LQSDIRSHECNLAFACYEEVENELDRDPQRSKGIPKTRIESGAYKSKIKFQMGFSIREQKKKHKKFIYYFTESMFA
jgi:hypothetical protein